MIKKIIESFNSGEIKYVYVKKINEVKNYLARIIDYREDSLIVRVHTSQYTNTDLGDGLIDTKYNNEWEITGVFEIIK